ncbi:hypothetical protein GCM10011392_37050 [Wenxinia marina]|nr:hypothetical protein GCM10011392_37050 [Wenxinia marina]
MPLLCAPPTKAIVLVIILPSIRRVAGPTIDPGGKNLPTDDMPVMGQQAQVTLRAGGRPCRKGGGVRRGRIRPLPPDDRVWLSQMRFGISGS